MKKITEYKSTYDRYMHQFKQLENVNFVLMWDRDNHLPEKAFESRANEMAYMERIMYETITHLDYVEALHALYEQKDVLDDKVRRMVELSWRMYQRRKNVPSNLLEDIAANKVRASQIWAKAKEQNNFELFLPLLTKQFELYKKYAEYADNTQEPYDVLMQEFEEGASTKDIDSLFNELKREIVELTKGMSLQEPKGVLADTEYETHTVKRLIKEIMTDIGFDFMRGELGETSHSYRKKLSANDIRINIAYRKNDLKATLLSALHELGHGLYEQGISEQYTSTSLDRSVSFSFDESQSRLLENMIGKSSSFWEYATSLVQKYFPHTTQFAQEEIVQEVNLFHPSPIRTQSDEITYNLHIMLRYDIEKQIFNNSLSSKDIPEYWNENIKILLGVNPQTPAQGCLQDVHWAMGYIGYFPTYVLGNMTAAQLWDVFSMQHAGWAKEVAQGDFSNYRKWFREQVWQHGKRYTPKELLERITGKPLSPKSFVNYLKSKYVN